MLREKKKEAHEIDQLMKRGQRNEREKIKEDLRSSSQLKKTFQKPKKRLDH
jgi:hypothetical protein